jgi:hypothetical protein
MDFSVLAGRDCLVVFAAVVLCSDRGVEAHTMGYDHGGIAHLTAKGAAGRTGLSQAASGRALRRLEEADLIIGDGERCLADQRGHLRPGRRRVTRSGARHRPGDSGRRD